MPKLRFGDLIYIATPDDIHTYKFMGSTGRGKKKRIIVSGLTREANRRMLDLNDTYYRTWD